VSRIRGVRLNHILVKLGVIGHTTRCGVFLTLITLCYLNKGLEVYVKTIGARVAHWESLAIHTNACWPWVLT
jgi:hypothetical protein